MDSQVTVAKSMGMEEEPGPGTLMSNQVFGYHRPHIGAVPHQHHVGPGSHQLQFEPVQTQPQIRPGPHQAVQGTFAYQQQLGPEFWQDSYQVPYQPQFGPGPHQPQYGPGPHQPQFGPGPHQPQFGSGPHLPLFGPRPHQPQLGQVPNETQFGPISNQPQSGLMPNQPQLGTLINKPQHGLGPYESSQLPCPQQPYIKAPPQSGSSPSPQEPVVQPSSASSSSSKECCIIISNVVCEINFIQATQLLEKFGKVVDIMWPDDSSDMSGKFILVTYENEIQADSATRVLSFLKTFGENSVVKHFGRSKQGEIKVEKEDLKLIMGVSDFMENLQKESNEEKKTDSSSKGESKEKSTGNSIPISSTHTILEAPTETKKHKKRSIQIKIFSSKDDLQGEEQIQKPKTVETANSGTIKYPSSCPALDIPLPEEGTKFSTDLKKEKKSSFKSCSPVPKATSTSLTHSRSKSPSRYRSHAKSKSPPRYRFHTKSKSPARYRSRPRSKSPARCRLRTRSKSPARYRSRSRSKSPARYRLPTRSKSPTRYRSRSRSKSPPRQRSFSKRHKSPNILPTRSRSPPKYRFNRMSPTRHRHDRLPLNHDRKSPSKYVFQESSLSSPKTSSWSQEKSKFSKRVPQPNELHRRSSSSVPFSSSSKGKSQDRFETDKGKDKKLQNAKNAEEFSRKRKASGSSSYEPTSEIPKEIVSKESSPFEERKHSLLKETEELKNEYERELKLYMEVPEVHPFYEESYSCFINKYNKDHPGKNDSAHLQSLWRRFWTAKVKDLTKNEYKDKFENLKNKILSMCKEVDQRVAKVKTEKQDGPFKEMKELKDEHDRKLELLMATPEIHPLYEEYYSTFVHKYNKDHPGKNDIAHFEGLWKLFWIPKMKDLLDKEYKRKYENLNRKYSSFDEIDVSERQEKKTRESSLDKNVHQSGVGYSFDVDQMGFLQSQSDGNIDFDESKDGKRTKSQSLSSQPKVLVSESSKMDNTWMQSISLLSDACASLKPPYSVVLKLLIEKLELCGSSKSSICKIIEEKDTELILKSVSEEFRKQSLDDITNNKLKLASLQTLKLLEYPRLVLYGQEEQLLVKEYGQDIDKSTDFPVAGISCSQSQDIFSFRSNCNIQSQSCNPCPPDKGIGQSPISERDRSTPAMSKEWRLLEEGASSSRASNNTPIESSISDEDFSFLEEVCSNTGLLADVAVALVNEIRSCWPNKDQIKDILNDVDKRLLLEFISQKTRKLSEEATSKSLKLKYEVALINISNVLSLTKSCAKEQKYFGLDIRKIARVTFGKDSSFTARFIRDALLIEGNIHPDEETITRIFEAVSVLHFDMAVK